MLKNFDTNHHKIVIDTPELATALEDATTEGVITITFEKTKNIYKLDSKKGTIEGPTTSSTSDEP